MWNQQQDQEDDSWEVRAFAEDTSNIMGTTWPPRSYTCTFCRREFRSAQALGGHMNVHRRDRARLHQASPNHNPVSPLSLSQHPPPSFLNGGLCLLYPFPSPNTSPFSPFTHNTNFSNACPHSPSTLYSVSSSHSHPSNNFIRLPSCSAASFDFSLPQPHPDTNLLSSYSGEVEQQHTTSDELDLELRLGNRSTSMS